MRIAISSDKRAPVTDAVTEYLRRAGHELVPFGVLASEDAPDGDWPLCSSNAAQAVARGEADQGVIFCWTGTGASIAANKVPGIRAALVGDARTAEGARTHNHANVLVLSIRATTEDVAREILDVWFATPYGDDDWNTEQVERVAQLEEAS